MYYGSQSSPPGQNVLTIYRRTLYTFVANILQRLMNTRGGLIDKLLLCVNHAPHFLT